MLLMTPNSQGEREDLDSEERQEREKYTENLLHILVIINIKQVFNNM